MVCWRCSRCHSATMRKAARMSVNTRSECPNNCTQQEKQVKAI